jgi:hypothetical protein
LFASSSTLLISKTSRWAEGTREKRASEPYAAAHVNYKFSWLRAPGNPLLPGRQRLMG